MRPHSTKTLLLGLLLSCLTLTLTAQTTDSTWYTRQWDEVAALKKRGQRDSMWQAVEAIRVRAERDEEPREYWRALGRLGSRISTRNYDKVELDAFIAYQPTSSNIMRALWQWRLARIYSMLVESYRYRELVESRHLANNDSVPNRSPVYYHVYSDILSLYESAVRESFLESFSLSQPKSYSKTGLNRRDSLNAREALLTEYLDHALEAIKEQLYHGDIPTYDTTILVPLTEALNGGSIVMPDTLLGITAILALMKEMQNAYNLQAWEKLLLLDENRLELLLSLLPPQARPDISNLLAKNEAWINELNLPDSVRYELTALINAQRSAHIKERPARYRLLKPYSLGNGKWAKLNREEIARITYPVMGLQINAYESSQQPILVRLNYRTTPEIYYRVHRWTKALSEIMHEQDTTGKMRLAALARQPVLYTQTIKPPIAIAPDAPYGDMQEHSTEIIQPGLPVGLYMIVVSDSANIAHSREVQFVLLQVTDMAILEQNREDNNEYYIVNRTTGEPLENVRATIHYNDESTSTTVDTKTDHYGYLKLPENINPDAYIKLTHQGDTLYSSTINRSQSSSSSSRSINENSWRKLVSEEGKGALYSASILIDRPAYRPGQEVQFKVIAYKARRSKEKHQLASNFSFWIALYDDNYNEIEKIRVKTNRYGSASGSFRIPDGAMLGYWNIDAFLGDDDIYLGESKEFKVLAYKRPQFELEWLPVDRPYVMGDTVVYRGRAAMTNGVPLTNQRVAYRVTSERGVRFRENFAIAAGTTVTDAKGYFSVTFVADTIEVVNVSDQITYKLTAEMLSPAGETRTVEKNLHVYRRAGRFYFYRMDDNKPLAYYGVVIARQNRKLVLPISGELTVAQLQTPDRLYIERPWAAPDRPLLSRDSFQAVFPYLPYEEKDQEEGWPEIRQVYQQTYDSVVQLDIDCDTLALLPGAYRITVLVKDETGTQYKSIESFQILPEEGAKSLYPDPIDVRLRPSKNEKTMRIKFQNHWNDPIYTYGAIVIDGREKRIIGEVTGDLFTTTVRGLDRAKRAYIQVGYVKHGQLIKYSKRIKDEYLYRYRYLDIPKASTYRKVASTGVEETWEFRLNNFDGEPARAEVLATMYDTSLDAVAEIDASDWYELSYLHRAEEMWEHDLYYFPFESEYTPNFNTRLSHITEDARFGQSMSDYNWLMRGETNIKRNHYGYPSLTYDVSGSMSNAVLNEVAVIGYETSYSKLPSRPMNFEQFSASSTIRTQLGETAFFYPHLRTDKQGKVSVTFTTGEALTRWRFRMFAHTRDLHFTEYMDYLVTRKDLMVRPNPPRFLMAGDSITYIAQVTNLRDTTLTGTVQLSLYDAVTGARLDELFSIESPTQLISIAPGATIPMSWPLSIPRDSLTQVRHRVVVTAGGYSDGEEAVLPVLPRRRLLTEGQAVTVLPGDTARVSLPVIAALTEPSTIEPHRLTLTYNGSPAWQAVEALPYLLEYPYDCTEQLFNKYYAAAFISKLLDEQPIIRKTLKRWADDTSATSTIALDAQLTAMRRAAAPWLSEALTDAEVRQRMVTLFTPKRLREIQSDVRSKLLLRSGSDGGLTWFPDGPQSPYITQYILAQIGRLELLLDDVLDDENLGVNTDSLIKYLDSHQIKRHAALLKDTLTDHRLRPLDVHYLYARSFYPSTRNGAAVWKTMMAFYRDIAVDTWYEHSDYEQAMLALYFYRTGDRDRARLIVSALRNRSRYDDRIGRYWPTERGAAWYRRPLETHVLLMTTLAEIDPRPEEQRQLRMWLLHHKRTHHWGSTKATADATYALLTASVPLLDKQPQPVITVGNRPLDFDRANTHRPGDLRREWVGTAVDTSMARIQIVNRGTSPGFGGVQWQYYQDLDRVAANGDSTLRIRKELYVTASSLDDDTKRLLHPGDVLRPGDLLTVRLTITNAVDLGYLHLQDLRPSGLEPHSIESGYQYGSDVSYYRQVRDASTDFFVESLPAGEHVVTYRMRVVHVGTFSSGIATVQAMYAPEYSAHSHGGRVRVE